MRVRIWMSAGIAVATVLAVGAWLITLPQLFASADLAWFADRGGDAARGRLIFAAGDCASCHASPGQSNRLRLGGGLALASPYGTFRVPNISMDPVDGIGNWQTKDLANALLSGLSPSGSHYYPVFPYASYTHMEPQNVADLMAYLRTLPAVKGRPPAHELASLFSVRRFVGFWKILYFRPGPLEPDPARDEKWNRGRYLVEAIGHCAECHSSRDMFGGIKTKTRYAGGQDPEGAGYYPNITPERIGHWSEQDLIEMLRSGKTPDHGRVGSSMADVVTNTAMLPESDLEAVALYIKSLAARPTPKP
ncbi:cytochrome c [Bradyrhizobium sp. BRP22]|uniref:c-type cytochrome n=1 Tax=Bradyrhizobium sp. BRP22 TaxID=2793821 RepID=UPI001CD64BA1|nr:cytochrome c [Bradyrhizobium sp. BRP22]MCA1454199.1 cytochrome c [Bradyrhizobium sp. BRP22]